MDEQTKRRLLPILENSKRGIANSRKDDEFAQKCFKKWPADYKSLHQQAVALATRSVNPFI